MDLSVSNRSCHSAANPLCEHRTLNIQLFHTHRPLPTEGNATDRSFFSSASFRQLVMVFSSSCWELFVFHDGPLQWMTNLAGKLWPGHMAAGTGRNISYCQRCSRPHKPGVETTLAGSNYTIIANDFTSDYCARLGNSANTRPNLKMDT